MIRSLSRLFLQSTNLTLMLHLKRNKFYSHRSVSLGNPFTSCIRFSQWQPSLDKELTQKPQKDNKSQCFVRVRPSTSTPMCSRAFAFAFGNLIWRENQWFSNCLRRNKKKRCDDDWTAASVGQMKRLSNGRRLSICSTFSHKMTFTYEFLMIYSVSSFTTLQYNLRSLNCMQQFLYPIPNWIAEYLWWNWYIIMTNITTIIRVEWAHWTQKQSQIENVEDELTNRLMALVDQDEIIERKLNDCETERDTIFDTMNELIILFFRHSFTNWNQQNWAFWRSRINRINAIGPSGSSIEPKRGGDISRKTARNCPCHKSEEINIYCEHQLFYCFSTLCRDEFIFVYDWSITTILQRII